MGETHPLHLVDESAAVAEALSRHFERFPDVNVRHGNILELARGAVVSPANGHGYMDGGIDDAYRIAFGSAFVERVREVCNRRPEGHLPVGASAIVRTGHAGISHLILAPTMLMPEAVPPSNCGRAMRAVLRVLAELPETTPVYCPGLGTGVGSVPAEEAASEMAAAYAAWGSRPRAAPEGEKP